ANDIPSAHHEAVFFSSSRRSMVTVRMRIITHRCRRLTSHHCHRLACLHILTRHFAALVVISRIRSAGSYDPVASQVLISHWLLTRRAKHKLKQSTPQTAAADRCPDAPFRLRVTTHTILAQG